MVRSDRGDVVSLENLIQLGMVTATAQQHWLMDVEIGLGVDEFLGSMEKADGRSIDFWFWLIYFLRVTIELESRWC
jgi:hypothetical protein